VIYLDTSALLKLYVREAESETVQQWIEAQDEPLPIWDVQHMELINAVRLKVYWGEIKNDQADRLITVFEQRLRKGQYFYPDIDRARLRDDFNACSCSTPRLGCRTMDILHVACAVQLDPDYFISFDARQRALAAHAGLPLLPAL